MRGATAKTLRRQARLLTEGAPAKAYLSRQHQKTRDERVSIKVDKPVAGEKIYTRIVNGVTEFFKRETRKVRITSEEIRLDPASTKGFYKMLKRHRKRVVPGLDEILQPKGI